MAAAPVCHRDGVQKRVVGSLLAGALGDAAGYLVEFDRIDSIRRRYGADGLRLEHLASEELLVSDDTQTTLFTLEGLLTAASAGDYTPERVERHIHAAYLDWFGTQKAVARPAVGKLAADQRLRQQRAPGTTCMSALACGGGALAGLPRGALNASKACGTVMRTAPIGWCSTLSPDEAFDLGMRASAITHHHPTAYIAGGAMSAIVRLLIGAESLNDAALAARRLAAARPAGEETVAAITAALSLAESDNLPTPETVATLGEGWVAHEALAIGLYAGLRGETMTRTLEIAINHSGDSDSTASIVGQLRGALEGTAGLSYELLQRIDVLEPMLDLAGKAAASGLAGSIQRLYPSG